MAKVQTRTRLTVYTALENEQLAPFEAAAEHAVPGIEIVWARDSTGIITVRLIAEHENPRADVIWGLPVFSLLQIEALNMLELYTLAGAEALRPNFRSPRTPMTWTGMDAFVSAICFNCTLATQRNLPRPATWADLLNPAFRNQVAMPNPASSGTGFLTIAGWIATRARSAPGTSWAAAQEYPRLYPFRQRRLQQRRSGEYTVGISFDMRAVALQPGRADRHHRTDRRCGLRPGSDGNPARYLQAGVARRLVDFTVTREAHELYGRYYALLGRTDVQPTVQNHPAEFAERLVSADFTAVATQRERILRTWTERFDGRSAPRN